jgi:curved DNA-binding protein CbpA
MNDTRTRQNDYYALLEVAPDASLAEIKSAYRRLAMRYHPDRNPDDPEGAEHFKRITLAYGVLSDPKRREVYDLGRRGAPTGVRGNGGGRVDPDEVFRDLFASRDFQEMFERLRQEFERAGLRSDRGFVRKVLGPGAALIFGGLLIGGPLLGGRAALLARALRVGQQVFMGAQVVRRMRGEKAGERPPSPPAEPVGPRRYRVALAADLRRRGGTISLDLPQITSAGRRVTVKVPPDTRVGHCFRIPGTEGDGEIVVEVGATRDR